MRHTITVIVENKFGVLARVSGLFSSRGYNIDSLAVGETSDPTISRMTIVVKGDDRILQQVINQLSKLIDVIEVTDLPRQNLLLASSASPGKKLKEAEKNHILNILTETQGNYSEAARILGISRMTLYNKAREYKINVNKLDNN